MSVGVQRLWCQICLNHYDLDNDNVEGRRHLSESGWHRLVACDGDEVSYSPGVTGPPLFTCDHGRLIRPPSESRQVIWVARHGDYDYELHKQRYWIPEKWDYFHCEVEWAALLASYGFSINLRDEALISFPGGQVYGCDLSIYKPDCPKCLNEHGGIGGCPDHYETMVMWTADKDDPFKQKNENCGD